MSKVELYPALRRDMRAVSSARFTFGGTIIETGTDSYRLAQTRSRAEQHATGQPR